MTELCRDYKTTPLRSSESSVQSSASASSSAALYNKITAERKDIVSTTD